MRRMILVLVVAALMAAMMVASALPALAVSRHITFKAKPSETNSPVIACYPQHVIGPNCIVSAPPPHTTG